VPFLVTVHFWHFCPQCRDTDD